MSSSLIADCRAFFLRLSTNELLLTREDENTEEDEEEDEETGEKVDEVMLLLGSPTGALLSKGDASVGSDEGQEPIGMPSLYLQTL